LLNNQLVCTFLLLVSLLTACSETTGGGKTEVSTQSNSPATNTTSIPTTEEAENPPPATGDADTQSNSPATNTTSIPTAEEAENPPPAAGDAVRIARWSRDPKGGSLLAPLKIRLAIVNNCLVGQNHQSDPPSLLIFPYDKGVWDDTKRTFTFEGKVIGIGEFIEVTGGARQNLDELKEFGKYDVPDCGANYFFQVF
jgi:hypothetical protein